MSLDTASEGLVSSGWLADGRPNALHSQPQIGLHGFLTPQHEWGDVERGDPLPYTLPPEVRHKVGLTPETWSLEIVADPDSDAMVEAPLSKDKETAITFDQLVELGKTQGVKYLKGVTCNNLGEPLGMGLWEGVPLRVLVWMAKPVANIRRVLYHGYHNDDPRQLFQSTLPIWRVLEEPPGELPILVAYKLNGEFISGKRGGPVRLVVPEAYGFKNVKWLQRVLLSNEPGANDTYRLGNNDLDSPMKTFARFLTVPRSVAANAQFAIRGIAQVGISGLSKVQYSVRHRGEDGGDWHDGPEILGPPDDLAHWGVMGADAWPPRWTVVHWQHQLDGLPAGEYELRCRTIDRNGIAQPMPRPFAKGGRAEIQTHPLTVQ
ncbi:MAG: molybdopterin-dependent oxidoreductase [Chloroflexi bacterium]|nr:molybdopterin-dependent oxidoreductase [Chloroflexota bacterium]